MPFSVDQLRVAFEAIPPRESLLLQRLLLDDQPRDDVQALLGVTPRALRIHHFRALRSLEAALLGRTPAILEQGHEREEAGTFAEALVRGTGHPLLELVANVKAQAPEVKAALHAARVAEESSPGRKREPWIRAVLVLGVLLISGYLMWQREAPTMPLWEFAKSLPSRVFSTQK